MSKIVKIAAAVLGVGAVSGAVYYFMGASGGTAHLKYVPKESALVGSINLKSLASKVDMARLKKMKTYSNAIKKLERSDELQLLAEVIEHPSESGLNLSSPVYFFGQPKDGKMETSGIVMGIKSAGDFEKMVRKTDTKGGIEKDDKYKHVLMENEVILGWNDDAAVLIFNEDEDDLEKELDNVMAQEKEGSIMAEPRFDEFKNKNADAGVWINYKEIFELAGAAVPEDMMKEYGLDEAAMNMYLNFDENKVALNTSVSYGKDGEAEAFDILRDKGVSDEHLKSISPDAVYAIYSANIDFKKTLEMLSKNKEMKNGLADFRENMGLSKEDLENLLTGELSLTLIDFDEFSKMEEEIEAADSVAPIGSYSEQSLFRTVQYDDEVVEDPYVTDEYSDGTTEGGFEGLEGYSDPYESEMYTPSMPALPGMVLNLSAKEPGAIERLIKKQGMEKSEAGYYQLPLGYYTVYMVITKSGLMVTNNKDAAEKMVKKQEFKIPSGDYKAIVSDNPMAMWMDLNLDHYPKKLMTKLESTMSKNELRMLKDKMKPFTSFVVQGKGKESEIVLNMTSAKESSLMRILEMVDDAED